MSGAPTEEVVTTWYGTFRRQGDRWVAEHRVPVDAARLRERLGARLEGRRTPEEEISLAEPAELPRVSWDRRLGLPKPSETGEPLALPEGPSRELHRELLLEEAGRRLRASWDPSIHVEEAVRSVTELEHVLNLLGERLVSWASRDAPPTGDEEGAAALARRLGEGMAPPSDALVPSPDPVLLRARAELASLYERAAEVRRGLESALETAMPERAPNLTALLGPILAAKMVSQAGGLDRLARLPAGTIQVLGAERSFFEHLRGRAPPPRHGWLFLHPEVQGAPKRLRGKLARGLAGKVAIAARLDQQGTPLRPEIAATFQRRAREIRAAGKPKGADRTARRGPLRPAT